MQILKSITIAEWLIAATGVLTLGNVLYLEQTGDFTIWLVSKGLYAIALVLLIVQREKY